LRCFAAQLRKQVPARAADHWVARRSDDLHVFVEAEAELDRAPLTIDRDHVLPALDVLQSQLRPILDPGPTFRRLRVHTRAEPVLDHPLLPVVTAAWRLHLLISAHTWHPGTVRSLSEVAHCRQVSSVE